MSMNENKKPYAVDIKAGTSAWICTCGQTGNAPFCDGAHQKIDGAPNPEEVKADTDTTVYICGCGKTGNGIYCDGSH